MASTATHSQRANTEVCDSPARAIRTGDFGVSRDVFFPPALPGALVRLELLLNTSVFDLQSIVNVIRGDFGLAVSFLGTLGTGFNTAGQYSWMQDSIVEHGPDRLRTLLERTSPLANRLSSTSDIEACLRFWQRARVTALVAEEFAAPDSRVNPDHAYFVGLLSRLAEFPSLFMLEDAAFKGLSADESASKLCEAWRLPDSLDIWRRQESTAEYPDRELAEVANKWVGRMEYVLGSQLFCGS